MISDALLLPSMNSLSPEEYNTLKQHHSSKKVACTALLTSLKLSPYPCKPVFVLINQMAEHDDELMEILLPTLDRLLAEDVRLVIIGNVQKKNEIALKLTVRRCYSKVAYLPEGSNFLLNRVFEGSHILLAPVPMSSGVFLLQALKYGIIPVVYSCTLSRQLVQEYDTVSKTGYGFIFYDATPNAFLDSVRQSIDAFCNQKLWQDIVVRAMMTTSFA